MEPIPNNGEKEFVIDKHKHTLCEYEHENFIIKKKHPNENFWLFEADRGSGSVKCFIGEISTVTVKLSAQHCGLGTIFTTLCFVDADMNGPNGNVNGDLEESNRALERLSIHEDNLDWVKTNCKSFWNLLYLADIAAANTYFNAALDSGFSWMLLEDSDAKIYGPTKTGIWKAKYDRKTGLILESIKVKNANWFFCHPN